MIEYPDEVIDYEWRVIWFPPTKKDQVFQGDEDAVRRKAARDDVAEWNPIIEKRRVVQSPWEAAE